LVRDACGLRLLVTVREECGVGPAIAFVILLFVVSVLVAAALIGAVVLIDVPHDLTGIHLV
jgi:hypothetical protein